MKKLCLFAFCLTTITFAGAKPDFSGTYAAEQKESGKRTAPPDTLRVVQTEVAIEVTLLHGDKSLTNRFPLDGSEGDYITERGVRAKCKAQLNNETLVLEILTVSPPTPTPNGESKSTRFRTIEKWRLSKDMNTLTIKTEIKSPDVSPAIMAAAFHPMPEKYRRTDKQ